MKVGIVQVDGKLPNLALMQIAGFHERQGHDVEWYQGELYKETYDAIYASKIFNFSTMPELPKSAMVGGTGIDHFNNLPIEIANVSPSYSLYRKPWRPVNYDNGKKLIAPCNYHLGFTMKGCRFACDFCVVPKKEGRPRINATIDDILTNPLGENRLMLLDNDFFGGKNWKENLERIIELKLKVCFVQGLNIRIISDRQAELLAKCKYYNSKFDQRYLTFAWDQFEDEKVITRGIDRCNKWGIPSSKMQFFVLIGFDTNHEQNMYRVNYLSNRGCMPYVMPYNKDDPYQKAFTRWVNHRATFKSCTWEEYKYKN